MPSLAKTLLVLISVKVPALSSYTPRASASSGAKMSVPELPRVTPENLRPLEIVLLMSSSLNHDGVPVWLKRPILSAAYVTMRISPPAVVMAPLYLFA